MKSRLSIAALVPQDWMNYHPNRRFEVYDSFYLKLANRLFEHVNGAETSLRSTFQRDDLKELAIVLTCHFEDFINDIGLWKAFVRGNQDLYNRPLPFYDLEGYDPEYLNPQDFAYFIWHFLSKAAHKSILPTAPPVLLAAQYCYDLFEAQIESAPDKSDYYRQWLTIGEQTPFFEVKQRLQWMAFGNYLLGPEINRAVKQAMLEIVEQNPDITERVDPGKLLYMLQDDFLYKRSSTWLARTTPEWLAEVAHCSQPVAAAIKGLVQKVTGNFQYESADEGHYYYRYIRSNRLFPVHRKAIDLPLSKMQPGEMSIFNLVKWRDDWWLSGAQVAVGIPSKAELDKIRINPEGVNFYSWTEDQQASIRELADEQEAEFLEFFGTRLVFFANKKAMQTALTAYQNYHNDRKAETSTPELEARMAHYGAILAEIAKEKNLTETFGAHQGMAVFYEPGEGVIISPALAEICKHLEKPALTKPESDALFYTFFKECTPAQARYVLEKYSARNLRFPLGDLDVEGNLDFWLRFYHPSAFREVLPNMSLLPEE